MPFNITGYTVPANGASAPYFVISRITVNCISSTINVAVNGYTSQPDYAAGLSPVTSQEFEISGSTYSAFLAAVTATDIPSGTAQGTVLTELIQALETNMLTLPFFSTATIVS